MTLVILFVLGSIVGSFLNVVGIRWDSGRTIGGRSSCPSCGKTLSWLELVPIVSFLVLRAQCLGCKAKISWQYPIVEIWTGLIFSSIFYAIGPDSLISILYYSLVILIFCIYVVITIYDFKYKIIPDELVYSAIFLSLLVPLFFVNYTLVDWLSGPIFFSFFASIWLLSRGRAMGFGDAKLGLSVGLLLGASVGFPAIIFSFWIGALGSLIYIFLIKISFIKGDKGLTMKSEVPFAPAIILGAWLALVFQVNIFNVLPI